MDAKKNRSIRMKLTRLSKTVWFWIGTTTLSVLAMSVAIEMFIFNPQAQRYFENSASITAQPLTTRSRYYLHKSLELMSRDKISSQVVEDINLNLDISYGLLNINLYIDQYPCAKPSLEQLALLNFKIRSGVIPSNVSYTRSLLPVIQCIEDIETGQDAKRSALAVKMLEDLNYQRRLLFWGILVVLVAGIGSWLLHLKQSRAILSNQEEKDIWINNAMKDALTGVFNRRAFDKDLPQYVEQYQEGNGVFSLLMCDIDFFKQYNDTLGHIEGDKALQAITTCLSSLLGHEDKLYRYGGEELVIILNQSDQLHASEIAKLALASVQKLMLIHPSSPHEYVTVSIGCATMNEHISGGESLVANADKNLYLAKKSGRNQSISE